MPDLAFGEGDDVASFDASARDILVVSMRGDRRGVPQAWIEGVRGFANRHGLKIHAVTQVERDAPLSRQLAEALGGTCVDWHGAAHHAKEVQLNDIYRRARITVSDRLHVLIASYTHGAIPVALQTDDSRKISRHFQAIGVEGVACNASTLNAASIEAVLDEAMRNGATVLGALPAARARLEDVRKEIARLVAGE
jgi:ribosomal protein L12E/L44/L45/RPP1/RPP2